MLQTAKCSLEVRFNPAISLETSNKYDWHLHKLITEQFSDFVKKKKILNFIFSLPINVNSSRNIEMFQRSLRKILLRSTDVNIIKPHCAEFLMLIVISVRRRPIDTDRFIIFARTITRQME